MIPYYRTQYIFQSLLFSSLKTNGKLNLIFVRICWRGQSSFRMTGFYLVEPEQGRMYLLGGAGSDMMTRGFLEYSVYSCSGWSRSVVTVCMQPSPKPLTPSPFSQKLIVLEILARGLLSPGWTLNNHKSQHTPPYHGTRGQPHHGTRGQPHHGTRWQPHHGTRGQPHHGTRDTWAAMANVAMGSG